MFEAETGTLSAGGTFDSNHAGFTGTGFANPANAVGAYVDIPVTADIVGGYGDSIEAVVDTVREVIKLGAVGVPKPLAQILEGVGIAFEAIRSNRVRAGLTMLAILCLPLMMLGFTAIATVVPMGLSSISTPGPRSISSTT